MSNDIDDIPAFTPGHFLTAEPLSALPCLNVTIISMETYSMFTSRFLEPLSSRIITYPSAEEQMALNPYPSQTCLIGSNKKIKSTQSKWHLDFSSQH